MTGAKKKKKGKKKSKHIGRRNMLTIGGGNKDPTTT